MASRWTAIGRIQSSEHPWPESGRQQMHFEGSTELKELTSQTSPSSDPVSHQKGGVPNVLRHETDFPGRDRT